MTRAPHGSRKAFIGTLKPRDPVVVDDQRTARALVCTARQCGLRASIKQVGVRMPLIWFTIL